MSSFTRFVAWVRRVNIRSIVLASAVMLSTPALWAQSPEQAGLPPALQKLVRAADEAEQKVRREGGVATDAAAEQRARTARKAARTAIEEYYFARAKWLHLLDQAARVRQAADTALQQYEAVVNAPIPVPDRIEKEEQDSKAALAQLADIEFKLDRARRAMDEIGELKPEPATGPGAGRQAGPTAAAPSRPQHSGPLIPGPEQNRFLYDPGSAPTGAYDSASGRYVFTGARGTFLLTGASGTASYTRQGRQWVVTLEFVRENRNFWYYRPVGDDSVTLWAFARAPECAATECKYAVWCQDSAGWHWEWTDRTTPAGESVPAPPSFPAPAAPTQPSARRTLLEAKGNPASDLSGRRRGA